MFKKYYILIIVMCLILTGCNGDLNVSSISTNSEEYVKTDKATLIGYNKNFVVTTYFDLNDILVPDAYLIEVGSNHALYLSKSDVMKYKYQVFTDERKIGGKIILIYESEWLEIQKPKFYYFSPFLKVEHILDTYYFDLYDSDLLMENFNPIKHYGVRADTIDGLFGEKVFLVKCEPTDDLYVVDAFTDEIYLVIPYPDNYSGLTFVTENKLCIFKGKSNDKIESTIMDIPLKGTGKYYGTR